MHDEPNVLRTTRENHGSLYRWYFVKFLEEENMSHTCENVSRDWTRIIWNWTRRYVDSQWHRAIYRLPSHIPKNRSNPELNWRTNPNDSSSSIDPRASVSISRCCLYSKKRHNRNRDQWNPIALPWIYRYITLQR